MDTVGNNDNFNFTGSIVSASLREALAGNAKKKWIAASLHDAGSAIYLLQNFGY